MSVINLGKQTTEQILQNRDFYRECSLTREKKLNDEPNSGSWITPPIQKKSLNYLGINEQSSKSLNQRGNKTYII